MNKLLNNIHKYEKGFSLVELMVVIVTIAILIAIAIPIYSGIQRSAAESAHNVNVRTLKGAAAVWYAENSASGAPIILIDGTTGSYQNGFDRFIEGKSPKVPVLLKDAITYWGTGTYYEAIYPNYHVSVRSDGTVTVVPGIGAYHK